MALFTISIFLPRIMPLGDTFSSEKVQWLASKFVIISHREEDITAYTVSLKQNVSFTGDDTIPFSKKSITNNSFASLVQLLPDYYTNGNNHQSWTMAIVALFTPLSVVSRIYKFHAFSIQNMWCVYNTCELFVSWSYVVLLVGTPWAVWIYPPFG